ncbi:hypothetical protein M9Y10_028890 [Tritrichomonas musculus]|uniref:Tubby C-terminal domain-containing protein n=1 Tax=Tritrichomonas musculus TaxID=1915356 RepID=A0ABR2KKJ9_9EUKA
MTFKILYFNGEEISRYMMNQPMANNYQFKGIFCKRKDRPTKKIKYYLYTEDMENIIMAAEKKQEMRLSYAISMDSNQIPKEGKFNLGFFKQDKKNDFASFSWHPQVNDSKRIMLYLKRHESLSQSKGVGSLKQFNDEILIPKLGESVLLDEGKSLESIDASQKFIKLDGSTEIIEDENGSRIANRIIKYDNNLCMSFYQVYEDEFHFSVLYPMSLFQAFSMALSYIE